MERKKNKSTVWFFKNQSNGTFSTNWNYSSNFSKPIIKTGYSSIWVHLTNPYGRFFDWGLRGRYNS